MLVMVTMNCYSLSPQTPLIKGGLSSQLVALIVHAWYCQQGEQYPPDLADDRNCEHCHLNH